MYMIMMVYGEPSLMIDNQIWLSKPCTTSEPQNDQSLTLGMFTSPFLDGLATLVIWATRSIPVLPTVRATALAAHRGHITCAP